MRYLVSIVAAGALMVAAVAQPALAGTATGVALGLASFAVFNQVVLPPRAVVAPRVVVVAPVVSPTPEGVVAAPPPAPIARLEVIPVRPGPRHVWVPGHWAWRGGAHGYEWIPGRWTAPVPHGVAWVPGHWTVHPAGSVWVDGHWARR